TIGTTSETKQESDDESAHQSANVSGIVHARQHSDQQRESGALYKAANRRAQYLAWQRQTCELQNADQSSQNPHKRSGCACSRYYGIRVKTGESSRDRASEINRQ